MIWVGGRLVPDDALRVSVLDRTFEHGLGLFETLRTWGGRAPLLDRHLARMERSAAELGIPLDRGALPDFEAVARLVEANHADGDALIRITLTGGTSDAAGSVLWMRSAPLPTPLEKYGAIVDFGSWWVTFENPLARHKTLNYWERRLVYQKARDIGLDEVVSMTPGQNLWEGSRTNLFVVCRDTLFTPSLDGPIVPGIMRGLVLELARTLPLPIVESEVLRRERLAEADEVFLTNSVRGIIPVARALDLTWPAPGPWTRLLERMVGDWLGAGRETT